MQHELPHSENDLEALRWAGGCLLASYVERCRAPSPRSKLGLMAMLALAVIGAASLGAGQWWYHLTPGSNQVFREDSNIGACAGFVVFVAGAIAGLAALLGIHDGKFHAAARAGRVCAVIVVPYVAVLALVSLSTPRTIVNIGDNYCYDLWCVGVRQVNATRSGHDILYTAEVRIFVDSSHPQYLPAEQAKNFFYVVDDQGRRYPLLRAASFANANVIVHPGESMKSSLAFLGRADVRRLYLMGNNGQPWMYLPWAYLYFGSDISLFHRRTLLRIA
jgi:hypothetical protein